ncbi:glycosyltransferase [Flavobacteriaceae bacterium D16]|nr:glycosyltransferase [Flavobacteriaceae bacterium D16]
MIKQKNKPLISVIVPVYNVQDYLKNCVESILCQSYTNIELILINDGSQDNSPQICDEFKKNDCRVIVVHKINEGQGSARNVGLKTATGDLICFVDSDDWINSSIFFETIVGIFLSNEVDIVEYDFSSFERKTVVPSDLIKSKTTKKLYKEDREETLSRIIKNGRFAVWPRVYKKSVLSNITFNENKVAEDVYYTLNIFQNQVATIYIKQPFYNYRPIFHGVSRGIYTKNHFESIRASEYLVKKIEEEENTELKIIAYEHFLKKLLTHYSRINYNKKVDSDYVLRREIKNLISQYYPKINKPRLLLNVVKLTPIKIFEKIAALNLLFNKLKKNKTFLNQNT